jgi:hypothetical protein
MAEILYEPPWIFGLGYSVSLLGAHLSSLPFPMSLRLGVFAEHYQLLSTNNDNLLSLDDLKLFAKFHSPYGHYAWIKQLRRSRYDRLKRLIPPCTKSTSTDAPMGAVLYPLGIPSWRQIATLHKQHRHFFGRFSNGTGISLNAESAHADWLMVQERGLDEEVYLAELPSLKPDQLLLAEYTQDVSAYISLHSLYEQAWPELA